MLKNERSPSKIYEYKWVHIIIWVYIQKEINGVIKMKNGKLIILKKWRRWDKWYRIIIILLWKKSESEKMTGEK